MPSIRRAGLRGDCGRAESTARQNQTTDTKTKASFYHAGCPVCVAAEQSIAAALDRTRYKVEVVHLGAEKQRVGEAERAGVKSVPALVLDGAPYHINFGADLSALK